MRLSFAVGAFTSGLQPLEIVTALRQRHEAGEKYYGVDVRQGCVTDVLEKKVVQPMHVTLSAVELAAETVAMIMKIDDIVMCR